MKRLTTPTRGLVVAALAGALALAGAAPARTGTAVGVRAVEGQPFSGAVATYTSTVTLAVATGP